MQELEVTFRLRVWPDRSESPPVRDQDLTAVERYVRQTYLAPLMMAEVHAGVIFQMRNETLKIEEV